MRVTDISLQMKNKDRVNVSVDSTYRFSLDIFQVGELGIRVGNEYTEQELIDLETESQFGKLYGRALEYTMLRPHSVKEIRDYLWRKTRTTRLRKQQTGEIIERHGVSQAVADRVYERLLEKGYLNDDNFARWWVESRNQTKGTSARKLQAELQAKGVDRSIINMALEGSLRNDQTEIRKVIAKKHNKYQDQQKLIQYLARQGFSYDAIKQALSEYED